MNADNPQNAQVTVAMLGARLHYALPRLLHEAKLLHTFFTDSYVGNKPWLEAMLRSVPSAVRPRVLRRWLGRKEPALPPDKVVSFETLGIYSWWRRYLAKDTRKLNAVFAETARRFNERIIRSTTSPAELLWGFNSASLEMFRATQSHGTLRILEQTIAPRRVEIQLLTAECDRWPGWQPTLVLPQGTDTLAIREENEWELADRIVCGSDFVVRGLVQLGVGLAKCRVVPYGVDLLHFQSPSYTIERRLHKRKLRVLFVGEVGLRKGVPYLLEALRKVGKRNVEARFVGEIALDRNKLQPFSNQAAFLGAVPRIEMARSFQWADLLVLPSICEGFGIVQLEALANGIPVVATPHCGPIVREGIDGCIVPIRDSDAIAEALGRYVSDPGYLHMQQQAARQGRERLGLSAYADKVVSVIQELIE